MSPNPPTTGKPGQRRIRGAAMPSMPLELGVQQKSPCGPREICHNGERERDHSPSTYAFQRVILRGRPSAEAASARAGKAANSAGGVSCRVSWRES